jgi:hypothetical protein
MHATILTIEMRATEGDASLYGDEVRRTILCVSGVTDIRLQFRKNYLTADIRFAFETSEAATKIHRKLTASLKKLPFLTISRIDTNLTDIFGKG